MKIRPFGFAKGGAHKAMRSARGMPVEALSTLGYCLTIIQYMASMGINEDDD